MFYPIPVYDGYLRMCQDLIDLKRKAGLSEGNNGLVGAVIISPGYSPIPVTSFKRAVGDVRHAERAAIMAFQNAYGGLPRGSILATTLSPCERPDMHDREGCSCKDLVIEYGLEVYCAIHDDFQGKRKPKAAYGYPITFSSDRRIRRRAIIHRDMIGPIEYNNDLNKV